MNLNPTLEPGSHAAVQHLLPWFANHSLTPDETAQVEAHLQLCAECRADAGWDAQLQAAASPLPAGLDPERALARLLSQLPPQSVSVAAAAPLRQRLKHWWQRLAGAGWMPLAVAGQTALIVGLGLVLVQTSRQADPASYRALGNGAATSAGNLVVMFPQDMSLAAMQRLLQAGGARIVDGPTVTGAYILQVAPQGQAAMIARLKGEGGALVAEPLAPAQP